MDHHNELLELANEISKSMTMILTNGYEITGQLQSTIQVVDKGYEIQIVVDPKVYDIPYFKKTGILKFIGDNSYANYVNDVSGGFSGTHLNFVQDAIYEAMPKCGFDILEDNVNG